MQTFAPEGTDLDLGFRHTDYRRLGKQRVEAWQILNVLRGVDNEGKPKDHKGWVHHPATLMWEGRIAALAHYGFRCCAEWKRRGYQDTMQERFRGVLDLHTYYGDDPTPPKFLNEIMISHRSNLIRKDEEFYLPIWPDTPRDLPYVWGPFS
jgi:hypothetical protein